MTLAFFSNNHNLYLNPSVIFQVSSTRSYLQFQDSTIFPFLENQNIFPLQISSDSPTPCYVWEIACCSFTISAENCLLWHVTCGDLWPLNSSSDSPHSLEIPSPIFKCWFLLNHICSIHPVWMPVSFSEIVEAYCSGSEYWIPRHLIHGLFTERHVFMPRRSPNVSLLHLYFCPIGSDHHSYQPTYFSIPLHASWSTLSLSLLLVTKETGWDSHN